MDAEYAGKDWVARSESAKGVPPDAPLWLVLVGNPARKRGLRRIFLAYASGYQVFKQHQFVIAALDTKPSRSDLHSIAGKTFLN